MKRLKGVKWKNSIGNGIQEEKIFDKRMYAVSDMILTTVCTLLFIVSACSILSDVFEWAKFDAINIFYMVLIAIPVNVAMESASLLKKREYVVKWGTLLIGIACFGVFLWFFGDSKGIISGMPKIISLYLDKWNAFYATNITFTGGRYIDAPAGFNFAAVFIFFVMMWLAKMTRRNMIAVIIPVIALASEFLIARWPEGWGIILMFTGVLLSNTMRWKAPDFGTMPGHRQGTPGRGRIFLWIVVCAFIFCMWGLVKNVGEASAKKMLGYADDVKEFRKEVIEIISDISSGDALENIIDNIKDLFASDDDKAHLSNKKPEYKNEVVLEVKIEGKPTGTVYLKGFDADTYDDGEWSKDEDKFEEACRDAGYDSEQISENIANLAVSKLLNWYGISGLKNCEMATQGSISYVDSSGIRAYCPYFIEKNSKRILVTGDSGFIKEKGSDSIYFYLWKMGTEYESYYNIFDSIAKEDWETWYEKYVLNQYLEVPDNMENVEKVAKEIEEQNLFNNLDDNTERLKKARLVASWLKRNTNYNLYLPELPAGEDCIEYFLGVSKTGYCMHYASASVMILRKLGVPARYVSGYIAPMNLFKYDSNQYVANVMDNKAHAWVEIYLEGIGWVPVEVTKGYSSPGSITPEDDIPEVNQPEEETTKPEIQEQPTTLKSENEVPTKDREENLNEQTTGSGIQTSEQTTATIKENESSKTSGFFTVLRILAVCIVIVGIPVFIILKKKSNNYNQLQKLIKRKRTLRAIKFMNRQIYRKLCFSGKTLRTSLNDAAYGDALKKAYPEVSAEEWDKYMDIVKAAAFSRRDFSVEEMEFCNVIYQKVVN